MREARCVEVQIKRSKTWRCVMAPSHAVERLYIKGPEFCNVCRKPVVASGPW
jgi:predicted Zn-dependent protease